MNVRLLEMIKDPNRKDGFEEIQKIGPVLEVNVTNHLERYGIQINIDSMQNDGTGSWIVSGKGIDKYVTELPEENKKPLHFADVATSPGQLVAMKQKEQFTQCSSSSTIMPINLRKWKDRAAVGRT